MFTITQNTDRALSMPPVDAAPAIDWPATAEHGELGDGRNASASDRPESIDALGEVIRRRTAEGLAIYPRGGRTALDHGGPPRRPGVAVDLTALDRVIDYPAADMTITVEAGITLAALQATLAVQGQRLPLDAPLAERATLGGVYATNASGPRRLAAGLPRDLIIGVGFATADGQLVHGGGRVVKNVAGYDFPKLLTGSMGSLGVIAELTLKVRPKPEASAMVWGTASGISPAALDGILARLNTSATRPVAVELLNDPAARSIGAPHGLDSAAWVLVLGFEDNADAVAWQLGAIRGELPGLELKYVEGELAEPIWSRLTDFQAAQGMTFSLLANLRPSGVVPFVARLDPGRWAVQSHALSGIVRAHSLVEPAPDDLADEIGVLRGEAIAQGGNLILTRCPVGWKGRLGVWGHPRADWSLMERVKVALDPAGAMNPGRFVGTI